MSKPATNALYQDARLTQHVLLSALSLSGAPLGDVQAILQSGDFHGEDQRLIYESLLRTQGIANGDAVIVMNDLRQRGVADKIDPAYFGRIWSEASTSATAVEHARKVHRLAKMRELSAACASVQGTLGLCCDLSDDDLAKLVGRFTGALMQTAPIERVRPLSSLLGEVDIAAKAHGDRPRSGLVLLDRDADLFAPGALTVLAGRPGMAKTSKVRHLLRVNAPYYQAACFTFEEPAEMLVSKLVCSEAGIPYWRWLQRSEKPLDERAVQRFVQAQGRLAEWKLDVADASMSADEVAMYCRRLSALGRAPRLIFVDHLQHMKHERQRGENDATMYGRAILTLANLAKELRATVILCCQLNRQVEYREEPRPYLSDLRDSGAIEQVAFNVLFLWANDPKDQERYLYLAKQRNGTTFEIRCRFDGAMGAFSNDLAGSEKA